MLLFGKLVLMALVETQYDCIRDVNGSFKMEEKGQVAGSVTLHFDDHIKILLLRINAYFFLDASENGF